jgi:hypothetical protein
VAILPAGSGDNLGNLVWEYFGGKLVQNETDWQNRTPETDGQLGKAINETNEHGYGHISLDIAP